MRVTVDKRLRRPWRVKWSTTRRHYLESPDGRLVASGFDDLWSALLWAQETA